MIDPGGYTPYGLTEPRKVTPKPTAVRTTVRRTSSPSRSVSTRSTSSRSSSSGGSSSSKKPAAPKKPATPKAPAKPSIPSIDQYLGTDAAYQQALSGGKRSLTDFISDVGRRRGEAGTQYNQTRASMERDRQQQLADLRDEYASRGLINSGLYGEQQGDFQQKFQEQMGALDQQQAGLLADLLTQENNYRRENDLATQQAKQEALLRRTQKFNIGG